MSATKALTRSRKRRAVADRPSRPGNRSLWFVTAERVREGSSSEGDDVASITGRSRDIPGTYARCEHKSSDAGQSCQKFLKRVVNGAPRSDVKIKGDAGSCSRLSRRRARSSRPDNGTGDRQISLDGCVVGTPHSGAAHALAVLLLTAAHRQPAVSDKSVRWSAPLDLRTPTPSK